MFSFDLAPNHYFKCFIIVFPEKTMYFKYLCVAFKMDTFTEWCFTVLPSEYFVTNIN